MEIHACWERLYNTLYIVDPWFILAFGKSAIEALVRKKVEVTKMRGKIFEVPVQGRLVEYGIPAMCCLHPSYLLRVADYKNRTGPYMKTVHDVCTALSFVDGLWKKLAGVEKPARPELP
jgi:uracil-DNA glycosylase family 4